MSKKDTTNVKDGFRIRDPTPGLLNLVQAGLLRSERPFGIEGSDNEEQCVGDVFVLKGRGQWNSVFQELGNPRFTLVQVLSDQRMLIRETHCCREAQHAKSHLSRSECDETLRDVSFSGWLQEHLHIAADICESRGLSCTKDFSKSGLKGGVIRVRPGVPDVDLRKWTGSYVFSLLGCVDSSTEFQIRAKKTEGKKTKSRKKENETRRETKNVSVSICCGSEGNDAPGRHVFEKISQLCGDTVNYQKALRARYDANQEMQMEPFWVRPLWSRYKLRVGHRHDDKIAGRTKLEKLMSLLNCTPKTFELSIRMQMEKVNDAMPETGFVMTWENYGLWEFDHRLPIAKLNVDSWDDVRVAFGWENIRPIYRNFNLLKGQSWPE